MRCLFILLTTLFLAVSTTHGAIDFKQGSVIVDDEVDEVLSDWIGQIFKVAGLGNLKPKIYLVVNPEINAAATVGGIIIINSGLIARCENASQFLGVMAHEVGHIAGGHISRMDQAVNEAMVPAGAAVILGGALALATGNPALIAAGLLGGGQVFERSLLKFTRTQESSADQAAIKYLGKLGWGVMGLRDFFKIIEEKTALYAQLVSPYAMTHPLTADRIHALEDHAQFHPQKGPSANIEANFQRLRGKVLGFFEPPKTLLQNISQKKLSPEGEQYAKAIALYRSGEYESALAELDSLIKSTGCAWYYELRGQILFDTGKTNESIKVLEQAAKKRPKAKYLRVMLAHAILESKAPNRLEKAKDILVPLTQEDPENSFAFKLLAMAHGQSNDMGQASLAMAEEAMGREDKDFAKRKATLAMKELPKDSAAYQRAKDVLAEIDPDAKDSGDKDPSSGAYTHHD